MKNFLDFICFIFSRWVLFGLIFFMYGNLFFIFILQLSTFWEKKYKKEIWIFCFNFVYLSVLLVYVVLNIIEVDLSLLNTDSFNFYLWLNETLNKNDLNLYMCLHQALCTFFFLGFIILKKKIFYADDSVDYQVYIKQHYGNPVYITLKKFWKTTFFNRKPKHLYILVLELPILLTASLFTLLHTRLINYRNVYLSVSCIVFLFGFPEFLLVFLFLIGVLSVLFKIPFVQRYFKYLYGESILNDIGWGE